MSISTVTNFLGVLTIIGQAGVALTLLGWPWRRTALRNVYELLADVALPGALLVVLGSFIGSLYFSQVALFPPCDLCWYQRIVMYPQAILIGLAMLKKNQDVRWQLATLSAIGFVIAVYQTYLQYGGSALVPCSTSSFAVSCAQQNFLVFGYITLPVMSLTGFAMLLVAALVYQPSENHDEVGQ